MQAFFTLDELWWPHNDVTIWVCRGHTKIRQPFQDILGELQNLGHIPTTSRGSYQPRTHPWGRGWVSSSLRLRDGFPSSDHFCLRSFRPIGPFRRQGQWLNGWICMACRPSLAPRCGRKQTGWFVERQTHTHMYIYKPYDILWLG